MRTVYTKMMKHNREENVMKGFIEVIRQITDECKKHEGTDCRCCPYIDDSIHGEFACYWFQNSPNQWDPLDIMRRIKADD